MSFLEQISRITLTHVLLMSLVLHAFVIAQPQNFQMWDESIFLEIARDFMKGDDRTPYQLPGLNFFIGTAMYVFGDNWFSWRVPLVIFGMLTLIVFYKICCRFTSERNALLATTILSFDSIFFAHSTLLLRDMPLIFFGMLSFYIYLKKRYYLCALPLGFAFLIKETAVFFLILITIYHLGITKPWKGNIKNIKTVLIFLSITSASFLLPLWIYDVVYTPTIYEPMIPTEKLPDGREATMGYPKMRVMESRGHVLQQAVGEITNPIEHLRVFLSEGYVGSPAYNVKNWKTVHTNYPWSWVLPLPLPETGNSLGWVDEKIIDETYNGILHKGKIFGISWKGDPNLSLWVFGFWSSIAFVIYSIKRRNLAALFVGGGIASMYIPHLLLSLTGRVMFPYYFLPTVPFISLGCILFLDLIKNQHVRIAAKTALLAGVVAWFVWFYPLQIVS